MAHIYQISAYLTGSHLLDIVFRLAAVGEHPKQLDPRYSNTDIRIADVLRLHGYKAGAKEAGKDSDYRMELIIFVERRAVRRGYLNINMGKVGYSNEQE